MGSEAPAPELAALAIVRHLFHVVPHGIPIIIDSKKLMPWEAAATWIEESEEGVRCQIHIRSQKRASPEVIAHEMVHAMRCSFNEPRFEEILAYQTSSHPFRRYFGPLFFRSWEASLLVLLSVFSLATTYVDVFLDLEMGGGIVCFLPLLWMSYLLARLAYFQRMFKRCLKNLEALFPSRGLALALKLTDAQIQKFSTASSKEVQEYFD